MSDISILALNQALALGEQTVLADEAYYTRQIETVARRIADDGIRVALGKKRGYVFLRYERT